MLSIVTIFLVGLGLLAGSDGEIRVTELPQQELAVAPGQYSGIAYLGGDRYAVVDDKLPGGGIVFFELPLQEDGRVRARRVRRTVPEATATSEVTGLDNEGIVYASGKLYVSAEGDQSIREYDLEGRPTGQAFAVPEDLGVTAIVKNGGFEALAYDTVADCFWTVTEMPLKADGKSSRLHRLQRFEGTHRADGRFLYQMDSPRATEAEAASAMAYVHGISALTVLDDGRLIVLEREVFVPGGRPKDILAKAFMQMKLYVVNPAGVDSCIVLPKQLLYEFETHLSLTAAGIEVALANYEGMCLGPCLHDGRRTLILLADSQAGVPSLAKKLGRKQVTREFVKVLLLEEP